MAENTESEVLAQQLIALGGKIATLEARFAEVDKVVARLEGAALTTSRSMQEISHHWDQISHHWDAVYEAMRREEQQANGFAGKEAGSRPRKRKT